jgi:type IV pilus assembly protein PilE
MHQKGFTLVELMVTVAIIAILASIALPSYQDSVRQTRRAAAQADLMELASHMERLYTANSSYGNASTALPDLGTEFYTVSFANNEPDDDSFIIIAEPTGSQADDACGDLSISNTGAVGVSQSTVAACW